MARPEIDLSASTILLGSSSALILAAENFDDANLINILLKTQKTDINYQSAFGETALMIAVDNNYYDTAKALIADENLNPNKKDISGTTVLMQAAKSGKFEIVKALLSHTNIDPNLCDNAGNTAISLALQNRHFKIAKELLSLFRISSETLNKYRNNAFIDASVNEQVSNISALQMLYNFKFPLAENKEYDQLKMSTVIKADANNNDEPLITNTIILEKIKWYLKQSKGEIESKNFESDCREILSLLWLYAKFLQSVASNTDWNWFRSTIQLIANIEIEKKLSDEEISETEKFISLLQDIRIIKDYLWTINLKSRFKESEFKKENFILFTPKQIREKLETVIQPDRLTLIKSDERCTALFKTNNAYYCLDPYNQKEEIKATSEKLAQMIFNCFSDNQNSTKSPVAEFHTISFDAGVIGYLELMLAARTGSLQTENYFLNKKLDIAVNGSIALQKAGYFNHAEIVKAILVLPDINPNIQDEFGYTPLMWAVLNDNIEIVKKLLADKNIDPNIQNNEGLTALMLASMLEQININKLIVADPKIDFSTLTSANAPNIAICKNQFEIIKALAAHPATNPNIRDINGWNPLSWAAIHCNFEIFQEILKNNAIDPNIKNIWQDTVLVEASRNNRIKIVKALLSHPKTNPNIVA